VIGVPGSITTKGLAVPGCNQWGVSCGKGSPAVANRGGRAAHSLTNGEGGTWERGCYLPLPGLASRRGAGWAGVRKEGRLGGLQAGKLQRARAPPRTCAPMLSCDPAFACPGNTYGRGWECARKVRLMLVDEELTPHSRFLRVRVRACL
jgi:hypothetical protein